MLSSWNSSTLATSCKELTHWKRLWCWEGLGVGGEGDDRGWDGWKSSLTRWMWVWVNSGSWWWTGRPGVLRFIGSQRVGHDWVTELNWTELNWRLACPFVLSIVVVQSLSPVRLSATPWTLVFPVRHYVLKFPQTHVHWVSNAIQPSLPLSFPSPPAFNFPSSRGFSNGVGCLH